MKFSLYNTSQTFFLALTLLVHSTLVGQIYPDHFGNGNEQGVIISSSPTDPSNTAENTLSGTGNFPDLAAASRFLSQAGFGGSYEEIQYVTEIGIDGWIDEQLALPSHSYLEEFENLYFNEIAPMFEEVHPGEIYHPNRTTTDFVWWRRVFQDEDVLRNKAAFALSQIFVISNVKLKANLRGFGHHAYYDLLYEGAFGNYRDMLENVSLNLMMGFYLSHLKNEKANSLLGTLPDENYAREIMQLFSIGLWELNNDGSQKLDNNNEPIPTYDIADIQEMAKVFTGLSGGAWNLFDYPGYLGNNLSFNSTFATYDAGVPMTMWEGMHEQGEKKMIDGSVLPAGQAGMDDIQDAIDVLFNHPNVGPFMALRLIQHLVTSNPSPEYISSVASAFNNNGQGVRGDLGAVFRAILTHPEARDCETAWNSEFSGRLKQPLERIISICRSFDIDSPSGRLWMSDYYYIDDQLQQSFMGAPSVFNFFVPGYAEETFVKPEGLLSPEFQILHAVTAINYLNVAENMLHQKPFRNKTLVNLDAANLLANPDDEPFLDLSDEILALNSGGIQGLLDRLDIILCQGNLSMGTRDIIVDAISQMQDTNEYSDQFLVKTTLYFIMISSDFNILR